MRVFWSATGSSQWRLLISCLLLALCSFLFMSGRQALASDPSIQSARSAASIAPNPVTLQWQSLPTTVHEADWRRGKRAWRGKRVHKTPGRVHRGDSVRRGARPWRLFAAPGAPRHGRQLRTYRLDGFGGIDLGLPFGSDDPQLTGGYTTVCVRLCDGYFFPISYSTNWSRVMSDDAKCQSSCKAPSKLYVYATGTDIDQAHDLSGQRYSSLPNAYLYRTQYRSDCRCNADPWTREAKAVHERYAALAKNRRTTAAVATYGAPVDTYRDYYQPQPAMRRSRGWGWLSNSIFTHRRHVRERAAPARKRPPRARSQRRDFWSW